MHRIKGLGLQNPYIVCVVCIVKIAVHRYVHREKSRVHRYVHRGKQVCRDKKTTSTPSSRLRYITTEPIIEHTPFAGVHKGRYVQ